MADRDSHWRRLLRTECLVTVAGSLGAQNKQLVREALRTLAHFASNAARETGAQVSGNSCVMLRASVVIPHFICCKLVQRIGFSSIAFELATFLWLIWQLNFLSLSIMNAVSLYIRRFLYLFGDVICCYLARDFTVCCFDLCLD